MDRKDAEFIGDKHIHIYTQLSGLVQILLA